MVFAPLLAPVVAFLVREVVVKFVFFTAIFGIVAVLVPVVVQYIAPFIGIGSLTAAFANLGGGVWFFLDFFQLGFGVPLLISAWVTRFIIRRLPVVG